MASISFRDNNHGLQIGDNHGSINAEFHLPAERPETPPIPLSTVPFARDPDFVSRDTLLDRIHERSSTLASRIALVGLGGVGKSQLAIEYSYRIRTKSPETWVFWVHASNKARFEQSFRDIADQLKIPGRQDPQANIFKLIENHLRDSKMEKWICILDNVDDDKLLCSFSSADTVDPTASTWTASAKPLLEYIPRSQHGSIIITSRSREIALKVVSDKNIIEVQPMEESEALELLQRTLRQPSESSECQHLVNALEFTPLAIVQAASCIRNRGPRYSVSQYLKDFQGSDNHATKLLETQAGHLYRDWEAKNSILVTWHISFDYIRQTKPSAAKLLSLMSLFDRQGIPENLIRHQSNANYTSKAGLLDDLWDREISKSDVDPDFEDDVSILRNFSIISVNEDNNSFTMHRLVQLATRAWLKSHGELDQWRDKSILNLWEQFPTGEYENWARCRPLFPHVKSAMLQRPSLLTSIQQWARLLFRGAWYALKSGNIVDVREMASISRNALVSILGDEHEEVLDCTDILATAYLHEGQWDKAEELEVQVMEIRRTKLGENHPSTLSSLANLASTYRKQGRWDEAEQFEVQIIKARKASLGEEHFDTLSSMVSLASTYRKKARWKEAEQLLVQVMEARRMRLGEGHPDTLSSMANLAATYRDQGRWEESEQLSIQAMKARKSSLGEEHPLTLTSIANLAWTYRKQGRSEKAEQLLVQVKDARHRRLGEDHPDTLSSMASLAATYRDQGRWEESQQLDVQVMEARRRRLGERHHSTLSSMASLAATYRKQGRSDEAEKLLVQVVEARKTILGEVHPDTLSSMASLASLYRKQGREEEAEKFLVHVIEIRKRRLGEYHPSTLSSMASLASTYRKQGLLDEAEQLLVQVMEARKTRLGQDHPDTLLSMASLAFARKDSGHSAQAIDLLRICVVKRNQVLGSNHPQTLASCKTLLDWERSS
ncbi:hypothetical protein N7481_010385 [Penicillium waksmanii]|uniref:uncharacterized protein n=1 Tax=Penicillium waksmanii TaxID=69791 RepID=UPI00254903F5|nr:uncharacterized protein N7481_010385 [Penicillium waksmanii]KAJ5973175.1 hypothetical protein N7481_010385 [Penicillium waksmanii]